MRIGFGTYAMPEIPVWDALPGIAEIGFEAVEICAAARWPTAPHKVDGEDRARLRDLIGSLGLELPALLVFVNMLAPGGEELKRLVQLFRDTCALGRGISPGTPPAVVTTL